MLCCWLTCAWRAAGAQIVAVVEAVGHGVKDLVPGDRVGMGFQVSACLACDTCVHGNEQSCPKVKTYFSTTGGCVRTSLSPRQRQQHSVL